MRKILNILEIGYPNCLIETEGAPISELIKTEDLINELFNSLNDYRSMYDDAYNHACEYQQRAHEAEKELREVNRAYEGLDI